MDRYLLILKEKANKISADIKNCKNDKDCIKDVLAAKVKSNLEKEDLSILKEKAIQIKADISKCGDDKNCILNIIEQRVKEILEEENQLMTSIDSQQDFKPLYFDGIGHNFLDMG
jgi:hypothetical protein